MELIVSNLLGSILNLQGCKNKGCYIFISKNWEDNFVWWLNKLKGKKKVLI